MSVSAAGDECVSSSLTRAPCGVVVLPQAQAGGGEDGAVLASALRKIVVNHCGIHSVISSTSLYYGELGKAERFRH